MNESVLPFMPRLQARWLAEEPDRLFRADDGAVVFVDISGFTKMSERLAKKGKVGAEEVTDVIGSVFARLLAIAYGNGGSLLKFGGDALLLWFTGDEHDARATRSAVAMRRELRGIGKIPTSAGLIGLRMSVGVHAGTYHFFLVGESHRELLVAGPAASRTVDMEGTAEAGEIVVSPELAARLPASAIGPPKGAGFLLRRAPSGLDLAPAAPPALDEAADLARALPVLVRRRVLAGVEEAEHRVVTVAFVHFDGTDAMIADDGPDRTAAALDLLVRAAQGAAEAHGVAFLATDLDHDGGKIILTAGAPDATGNDDERMLLALRRIVDDHGPIPIRVGVNRGPVFAGAVGPPYRRTYTVMGDAVNLAARVMAKASPGQLLATSIVLANSRTSFETEALEPFSVKGKAKPVIAHAVGAPVSVAADTATASTVPLIGREEELALLLEAVAGAREGGGSVVELVAEPGMGKSRLIDELVSLAAGVTVVRSAAELYTASSPFAAVLPALRRFLGLEDDAGADDLRTVVSARAPDLLPWLPLVGIPFGVELDDTEETAELDERFRAPKLQQVLSDLVRRSLAGPALFVIEDGHWLDEPSAGFVRQLAADLAAAPLALVVTRREDSELVLAVGPHAKTVRLAPLPPEAAQRLLEAATEDRPLAPHEMAELVARSGGNPLFLGELATSAQDAGGTEGLPDTVEALIAAQIDRLPTKERSLLRHAAVLGSRFGGDLATAVLGDTLDALGPMIWLELGEFVQVDPEGAVGFRHALIRDAAYEGLPFRQRRSLHARAGEAIEAGVLGPADEQVELLSFHFSHAGDHERAFRYSEAAARKAHASYANVEAATFYRRALTAGAAVDVDPETIASLSEALGDVHSLLGTYGAAAAAYKRARTVRSADPLGVAALLLKEGMVQERRGSFSGAARWFRRGLDALEGLEGDAALALRAELRVRYASARQSQGRAAEAIPLHLAAAAEAERAGALPVVAHAAYRLDDAYSEIGDPDASPYRGRALEIYEELEDLEGIGAAGTNAGTLAYFRGDWDRSVELWTKARDADRRRGSEIDVAHNTNNLGEVLSDQGHYEEAERNFREVLRITRAAGVVEVEAFATSNLGRIAARTGRHEEATTLLERARQLFVEKRSHAQVFETDARILESLVLRGQPSAAVALAHELLARASRVDGALYFVPIVRRALGYAHLQLGETGEAEQVLESALAETRELDAAYEEALTLQALARVAEVRDGTPDPTLLEQAAKILDGLGVVRTPDVPLGESVRPPA